MESEMIRILMTAATVANLFASPALAQSLTPAPGADTAAAPYAVTEVAARHGRVRNVPRQERVITQSPFFGAYAQSPDALYGHRWPGAHYDANGYYIDPNSPGRW
jgi:hypothetical protein